MKSLHRLIATTIILLSFLFVSGSAFAQSANDWPTFMTVPSHTGFNAAETVLQAPPNLAWQFTMDSGAYGEAVVSDGTAYVKSLNGTLYAINISDGTLKWSVSTPAGGYVSVSGNRVYATTQCNNCSVQTFDTATGQLVWSSTPLPGGSLTINVESGKVFYAGENNKAGALDASTGATIWQTSLNASILAFPAVANGVVYVGDFGTTLYALNASTGAMLWSSSIGSTFVSSPAVVGNTLYIGQGGAALLTVDATNGQLIRQTTVNNSIWASPAVANNRIYVQSLSGFLYAIDATNGSVIWSYDAPGDTNEGHQSAAVANGVVYGGSINNVYAVNEQTGAPLWQFSTGAKVVGIVVADHKLFVASRDGKIYAFTTSNKAPAINPISDISINEGDTYKENGSFTDSDSTSWTVTVDYGDGSGVQPLTLSGTNFSLNHVYKDNGVYTVTVSITDNQGATGTGSATVTVNNVAPTVGPITAPTDPVQVNTTITASGNFTDLGVLDTHTALWNWGDGTTSSGTVTETNGSGTISGNHIYTSAGVYTITLTVTDKDGGIGTAIFQYVVVYDPSAGYITGAGTITSPLGAYTQDPSLSGKAIFGFVSKYQNGANLPTGSTQFRFTVANFSFKSTSYDWLVVGGARAQYKGSGTINGSGDYAFILSSIDGQLPGGGGTDKFRIKITDKTTNVVIYDNQLGASDTSDPTTAIDSGSIVIHH